MTQHTYDPDAFNAFERHGWETNSTDAYQEVFGPITSQVIDDLLNGASVRRWSRVLDVGTGPGYVAVRAAERGATVTGVDVSEQMLGIASARHPGMDMVKGDAESLPFPEASFSAVVGNFCILHVGRPERAAESIVKVLRPGGGVALSAWRTPDKCPMFGAILEAVRAAGVAQPQSLASGPDFFRFASESEFWTLLSGAGLQGVRVRTVNFKHVVPGVDHLWRGFAQGSVRTRALLLAQPEEVRLNIRDEFARRLKPFETKRGIKLPFSVNIASGAKSK